MDRVRTIFLWMAVVWVPIQDIYSHPPAFESLVRSTHFTLFEENGKVGLKDEEGRVLIPATYDAIGWSNGKLSIIDKVVGYRSNGLWGLIHTSNRIVTPAEFLELKPGEGSFLLAQKTSALSQRPSFGIINTSGKEIIPCQYDGLQLQNMRAVVMSKSGTRFLFGLTDLSHRVLIPLKYQRIFSLGSLRFAVEDFDNKTAIFSDDGSQVTGFTIDSISRFKKDYAIVFQNQRQGLINRSGHLVVEPSYGGVRVKEDGTIEVRETDSWFFLDGQNKLLGGFQADVVKPLSPGHYAVRIGGRTQLTNSSLKPLHAGFFSAVADFSHGIALFKHAGKTGAITEAGKILIPAVYENLVVDGNFFLARLGNGHKNRWVVLDRQGNHLTEKQYEYIAPFNGKYYAVRNRGFWGAVDQNGTQTISCVHDSLMQQKGDHVVVKFKGQYGIINLHENWIVTPQINPLALLDDEAYFEFADKTTFLKSFSGNIIYFSDNRLEYAGGYVRENLESGAYWIIDMNGLIADSARQPLGAETVFRESEGFRAIRKDGKFGFIDNEGRLRIANRYEAVKPFSGGLAAMRIRNKWGFIDPYEKLVVQPVYDDVEDYRGGHAIVRQENRSGLLNGNGKIVLPLRYDEISRNDHNRFTLRIGKLYGLADASGTVIIHPKFDGITDTGNGYVVVQRDGKFGLLTLQGVNTIPMVYDDLTFDPYHNHYLAVKKSPWIKYNGHAAVHGP